MKIYIINPDNNNPVSVEEWRKESDPTRAEFVAIGVAEGILAIKKNRLPVFYNFKKAQAACAALEPIGKASFRCPTRKEFIDIYDARFQGLDEALALVGGDPIRGLMWTCERDTDPRSNVSNAWYFGGADGTLYHDSVNIMNQVEAVTLLNEL
jgi:hypothetical protein